MAEIPLTQGKIALVDAEDLPLLNGFKWFARRDGQTWYAWRHVRLPDGRCMPRFLHTLVTGFPRVDHINGNGLDNRRANLRAASASQNQMNIRKHRGTSQFKGVHRQSGRWCAQIKLKGIKRHLGYFTAEADAAAAYDTAARALFGEFAALNFPNPGERGALHGVCAVLNSSTERQ